LIITLPPLDARIPKWNLADLVERCCPICNSAKADTRYQRPDELKVCHCSVCNTFFVCPAPSDGQLQAFYQGYDETHRRAPKISPKELATYYESIDPMADFRIRKLNSLLKLDHSRVLDIGFGRAYFLYCLKKLGAVPYGLELDTQAVELAKLLGIENVFQQHVADFAPNTKFDLITLIDLVEHPLNPMDLLKKASGLMQPGGFLMIWTPNGDFVKVEQSLTTFRVDLEHMQYLTPEACITLASSLNLRIVHLETLGVPRLEGIDTLLGKDRPQTSHFKKAIKSIPGFSAVNAFRKQCAKKQDERSGSYNLFCIMQKPD